MARSTAGRRDAARATRGPMMSRDAPSLGQCWLGLKEPVGLAGDVADQGQAPNRAAAPAMAAAGSPGYSWGNQAVGEPAESAAGRAGRPGRG